MSQSVGAVALDIVAGKNTLGSTIKNAMGEAQNIASSGASGIGNALGKIGSVAGAVGKTVVAGIGVASGAVVALGKEAVASYADYEQLVGGVETLFKDSASTVIENASKAYMTAGLSANEYMETVTSFSASLLQSLGGDTVKASEKANMAITDMSDNANKMGTSMEMIQNAYNGFAKQNYTMLDNLKLGYGGTKEEMARLLADATAISGIEYDISSYGDVVDAIHVIQTEMGITGTTAKEASSTISGSIGQMKGAWANLLTGIGDDTQDFGALIDNFVASVETVGDNLLPRIEVVLGGVVKLVQGLAPKIIEKVPSLISQLLPPILSGATSLLQAVVSVIPELVNLIVEQAPVFIDACIQIIESIVQALPVVVESLASALPTLLPVVISGLVKLIVLLCQILPQIIQPITDNLPLIITSVVDALIMNLPILIQGLIQLVVALGMAIPQILSQLWTVITDYCSQGTSALFAKIKEWILLLFPQSGEAIWSVLVTIKNYFVMWIENIKAVLSVIVSVISTPFKLAWNGIKQIWSNCVGFFSQIISNVKQAFSNVYEILSAPFQKAKDAIDKIVDKIKDLFKNLKLKFPSIKLPHFTVKPSGWEIGDLLKGKIPSLGIDWYAKAMNNPMIMTKPTIFGYDAGSGNLLGGGEAGSELVVGTNTLLNMIKSAVASVLGGSKLTIEVPALQNVRAGSSGPDSGLSDKMDRLIELFKQFIESGDADMTVPIYIGNELIDEYILNKSNRAVLRSGGRA
jgi:phage-related protein